MSSTRQRGSGQFVSDKAPNRARDDAPDFLEQTLALWQPRTKRQLTREDAREINENLTGFFRVLMEWARVDQEAAKAAAENEEKASLRQKTSP